MNRRGSRRRIGKRLTAWWRDLLGYDLLWTLLAVIAVMLIVAPQAGLRQSTYAPDDVALSDVKAPMDFQVSDPVSTARRQTEASDRVQDLYDYDPNAWQPALSALNPLFSRGRFRHAQIELEWADLSEEQREGLREESQALLAEPLPEGLLPVLWDEGYTVATELQLAGSIKDILTDNLVGTLAPSQASAAAGIRVRDISNQRGRTVTDVESILDIAMARDMLRRDIAVRFELSDAAEQVFGELGASLLGPNLNYNSNETRERRQQVVEVVEPAFYQVKRGRTIIRAGDEVTEQHIRELQAMQEQLGGGRPGLGIVGITTLVALAVISLWRFVVHYRRRFRYQRVKRLYILTLLVLVGMVAFIRFSIFVAEAVASSAARAPFNSLDSYLYAIPFAAGAVLLLLLVDTQVAWAFAGAFAVIVGAFTQDLGLTLYAMVGSFAGIYGMSQYKQRTALAQTGLLVGAVNAIAVFGLSLIEQPPAAWEIIAFSALCAFLGGVLVSMLATFALPPLEHLFGSLTDIKLLELSNMNLPLLKELAVQAPGTYHHSVVVGTLAEKAAEAIEVNSLFTRVAAYYHDIGKMQQPQYFVENQKGKQNPHDKLSPSMSVLVLTNHVKEGIAYGEEYGLPQPLIDVIPQHHGTRQILYFLDKAKQLAADGEEINPEDFRYPGPKPQTKEAAILMLADSVEAVSRTLTDPSPGRMRARIHKTIHEVLEDGQFNECGITMADLAKSEDAFLGVLAGMHHQRIEYPSADGEAEDGEGEASSASDGESTGGNDDVPEGAGVSLPDEDHEERLPGQTDH
jgi:putative nucleotidyltransferase with HDIG domain